MSENEKILNDSLTGLYRVDLAFRLLLSDLEAFEELRHGQRRAAVEALPWDRRVAVGLVAIARAAHEDARAEVEAFARELPGLRGPALVQRQEDVVGQLRRALHWIPPERTQALLERARADRLVPPLLDRALPDRVPLDKPSALHRLLRLGEGLTVAHVATSRVRPHPAQRVREYARLLDLQAALEADHWRRRPVAAGPGCSLAAFVVASGIWPSDEASAMDSLEKDLPWSKVPAAVRSDAHDRRWRKVPLAEQSDKPDRLRDGAQDLRRHLLELLRALGARSPKELLGRLYDNDPDLRYIPHHAWRDFLNQQARDAQDALLAPLDEASEGSELASVDDPDADFPTRSEVRPFEPSLPSEFVRARRSASSRPAIWPRAFEPSLPSEFVRALGDADELDERGADALERLICRMMKHTATEQRILRAIFGNPDGTDVAIAETVACSREYVNKYRRRLRLAFKRLMR